MLLRAVDEETGRPLSAHQICSEILTLAVAGTETTASVLSWILYELARRPDIEARVLAELGEVLARAAGHLRRPAAAALPEPGHHRNPAAAPHRPARHPAHHHRDPARRATVRPRTLRMTVRPRAGGPRGFAQAD